MYDRYYGVVQIIMVHHNSVKHKRMCNKLNMNESFYMHPLAHRIYDGSISMHARVSERIVSR